MLLKFLSLYTVTFLLIMPLLLSFRKGAGLMLPFNQARHSIWTTVQQEESTSVRPEGAFLNLEGSKLLETHNHFHFNVGIVELTGFMHSGLQVEKCDL